MKYGHNKRYVFLRWAFAATPCETDEGLQKTVQKNAEDCTYYDVMAHVFAITNYQNYILQTGYYGKHFEQSKFQCNNKNKKY
jgi:hypothetical protein